MQAFILTTQCRSSTFWLGKKELKEMAHTRDACF